MAEAEKRKLSLFTLTAMVTGSMLGAGIFYLPGRFATATGPFGAIIAWTIAGTGMYMLARVFRMLARRRPELDTGVFSYAKAGFGNYAGFLSGFGYWLGGCLGNVFYWVLIGSTLAQFFPDQFGDGTTPLAIVVALAGIWTFHFVILRGLERAALLNAVVTAVKFVPILVAIVTFMVLFNYHQFAENFFGGLGIPEPSIAAQVRDTMLITIFAFLGVEGASVFSRHARSREDVGTATILGFVAVTGLMVAVTLLPYATAPRADIAGEENHSLAGIMQMVVGQWGAVVMTFGVLISVLGAYLAWSLICTEVLFATASAQDMPGLLARQNSHGVPANALLLTNIVVSLFVVSTYWSVDAFNFLLNMTSVSALLPYLLVAGFGVMVARSGAGYDKGDADRVIDLIAAGLALAYTLVLFIAAGLQYILLIAVVFVPGTLVFYAWARREQGARLFNTTELLVFCVTVMAGAIGLAGLIDGTIVP